jgi:methylenetetrahydrofolate dehydrogenase (NADP+)/methenyltetrahydrofolate cyclohydrolase
VTADVIDGRKIAHALKTEVAAEAASVRASGIPCGLAIVLIGHDYGSRAYLRRVARVAEELEVPCEQVLLPADTSQHEALATIERLNTDPAITGVLVLRPLPPQVCEVEVFAALAPGKDIESVHPHNAGLLAQGSPRFVPSTAASVFHLLDHWLDEASEDRARFYHRSLIVVVGRSNNVGKPAISLAYDRQAAVMSVDEWASKEGRLGWHTRQADVLVVAAGVAGLITAEHVRPGAVVVDVGINPAIDENGHVRMVGDVDFEQASARARAITPVPGGVGPITDVWLIRNTVRAAIATKGPL